MAWNLTADFIETCSCNMLCPCWYGVRELMVMDQGWCASTWLLRVQHGQADGVNLGGRTVAMTLDFPAPTLYDGDGTARLYIDDGASADQRRELEGHLPGHEGGPMAIVGGLVATWLPTQTTQIAVQEQGGTLTATVAGFGEVRSQPLTNDAGQPTLMQNTGFTTALQFDNQAAQLAPSGGTRWADPAMPRPFETKSGAVATFTWSVS
jgi:hypothetical protein